MSSRNSDIPCLYVSSIDFNLLYLLLLLLFLMSYGMKESVFAVGDIRYFSC